MSFFLCVLVFKMVHSSIQEKPSDFIFYLGFAFVMVSKAALPNIHGQNIRSKSEELVNELYGISWYDLNLSQKKALLILMTQSQRTLAIKVKGFFNLDLRSLKTVKKCKLEKDLNLTIFFFQIFEAAFSFYSVLKSTT